MTQPCIVSDLLFNKDITETSVWVVSAAGMVMVKWLLSSLFPLSSRHQPIFSRAFEEALLSFGLCSCRCCLVIAVVAGSVAVQEHGMAALCVYRLFSGLIQHEYVAIMIIVLQASLYSSCSYTSLLY